MKTFETLRSAAERRGHHPSYFMSDTTVNGLRQLPAQDPPITSGELIKFGDQPHGIFIGVSHAQYYHNLLRMAVDRLELNRVTVPDKVLGGWLRQIRDKMESVSGTTLPDDFKS